MGDIDYQNLTLPAWQPGKPQNHPRVIIVGAGPVGLSLALDLAGRGHHVRLIDKDDRLSEGSRAICFSKRSLDIWDRLGVAERMVTKGVSWNVGKVFFRNDEVWRFDLLPEPDHRRPAFINLQQYYCEGYLHDAAGRHPRIELCWQTRAIDIRTDAAGTTVQVQTPDGEHTLHCDWLIACDGARSSVRKMLGLESHGRVFQDRFLIADVRMDLDQPPERWYWFDPPFHRGQSVLLHRQPDNVWRVDFQLGWDADPVFEARPENVIPRIRALLGGHADFELEWVSVYTFACERMERFRHGRVLFAGDTAYRVSPFGARGANSGLQDSDNLAWKLDLTIRGLAPEALIDSYCSERGVAADENLLHSTRATDFITPKSEISLLFRNVTLALARHHAFARTLVNSGRLSTTTAYTHSSLTTPDQDGFDAAPALLGDAAPDGPIRVPGEGGVHDDWWLGQLDGRFVLALFCTDRLPPAGMLTALQRIGDRALDLQCILVVAPTLAAQAPDGARWVVDDKGLLRQRYDAQEETCYLIRPDQHIAARWRRCEPAAIARALQRALAATP